MKTSNQQLNELITFDGEETLQTSPVAVTGTLSPEQLNYIESQTYTGTPRDNALLGIGFCVGAGVVGGAILVKRAIENRRSVTIQVPPVQA